MQKPLGPGHQCALKGSAGNSDCPGMLGIGLCCCCTLQVHLGMLQQLDLPGSYRCTFRCTEQAFRSQAASVR